MRVDPLRPRSQLGPCCLSGAALNDLIYLHYYLTLSPLPPSPRHISGCATCTHTVTHVPSLCLLSSLFSIVDSGSGKPSTSPSYCRCIKPPPAAARLSRITEDVHTHTHTHTHTQAPPLIIHSVSNWCVDYAVSSHSTQLFHGSSSSRLRDTGD